MQITTMRYITITKLIKKNILRILYNISMTVQRIHTFINADIT